MGRKSPGGSADGLVLVLNAGSSSIRFAVFASGAAPQRVLAGKIERAGARGVLLLVNDRHGIPRLDRRLSAMDYGPRVEQLLDWLEAHTLFPAITAVGHRVVHGMQHSRPARVTPRLLASLHRITPYDPEHMPQAIGIIEALRARHPRLAQVACFDTAFHRTMPRIARLLPIPRRYQAKGVERYGFHGISCAYLMQELRRLDPIAARGRVLLAHLGNGASLTAVHRGQSVDTSMGFTPAAGLVMSSRTGDLDPGVLYYLAQVERMSASRLQEVVTHESGLRGVSGTSSDMRDLLAAEGHDPRAADAVGLFCYQVKKWIGAYAAALGGIDTLVFAGGIGEHAPPIRARICADLEFLGIALHRGRNARGAPLISRDSAPVAVRVIPTDEELMIARSVRRTLRTRAS